MVLRFFIENHSNLPDGGPIEFSVTGKRSVDIGRDQHLDWTLPDPTRFISGKHCEVHYRDGSYWLHDVSTNGTFLNGAEYRMRGPHVLRNGDRLIIGQYIVGVSFDGAAFEERNLSVSSPPASQPAPYQDLWSHDLGAPPPIDPKQLKTPKEVARPIHPGFLDWAASVPDVPQPHRSTTSSRTSSTDAKDMDWAQGSNAPAPELPPLPKPSPRRPVWGEQDSPWGSEVATKAESPPAPNLPLQHRSISAQPHADVKLDSEETSPAVTAYPSPVEEAAAGANKDLLQQLARAAGLPDEFFSRSCPSEAVEKVGQILRISVENLMSLLQGRHEAKLLTRSRDQTTVQATENNPLKFSPTSDDAMRILFGPPTRSYLDANRAFSEGFSDLKTHNVKTYAAMQQAIIKLLEEIDPTGIQRDNQKRSFASFWNRDARFWNSYVERWNSRFGRGGHGAVDRFMVYFAEHYDKDDGLGSR